MNTIKWTIALPFLIRMTLVKLYQELRFSVRITWAHMREEIAELRADDWGQA